MLMTYITFGITLLINALFIVIPYLTKGIPMFTRNKMLFLIGHLIIAVGGIMIEKNLKKRDKPKVKSIAIVIFGFVFLITSFVVTPWLFKGRNVNLNKDEVVYEELKTYDLENMTFARVDKDTALAMAKMKLSSLGSDYSIYSLDSEHFTKAIYNDELVRFAPLIKNNKIINKGSESNKVIVSYLEDELGRPRTEIVDLKKPMKYYSNGFFNENALRRFHMSYPGEKFKYLRFELDNENNAYWIANTYKQDLLNGSIELNKVAVMDAHTGEIVKYEIGDTPEWLDNARPAKKVLSDYHSRLSLINGARMWNSKSNVKLVDYTGGSYTYARIGDDLYALASILPYSTEGEDRQDSIGMAYVNLRTNETLELQGGGVSLRKAIEELQDGQHSGVEVSVPHLTKVDGMSAYVSMLKDRNSVTSGYGIISYDNFLVKGYGSSMTEAINKLKISASGHEIEGSGSISNEKVIISKLEKTSIEGTEYTFLVFEGIDTIFKVDATASNYVPFLRVGQLVKVNTKADTISYIEIIEEPAE